MRPAGQHSSHSGDLTCDTGHLQDCKEWHGTAVQCRLSVCPAGEAAALGNLSWDTGLQVRSVDAFSEAAVQRMCGLMRLAL